MRYKGSRRVGYQDNGIGIGNDQTPVDYATGWASCGYVGGKYTDRHFPYAVPAGSHG